MSEQSLRDLEWVVTTPSLLDHPLAVHAASFDADAIDADHLASELATHPVRHRVGLYFEDLVEYWLTHVVGCDMVGRGIQISNDESRTIGEIDLLFRPDSNVLTHWEAAVKFFLYAPGNPTSEFPGPNARDNFERKSTQLLERQLQLSARHVPDVEQRGAFVKGRIFLPFGVDVPGDRPAFLSLDCFDGGWLRADHLDRLGETGAAGGHVVHKPHWFAAVVSPDVQTIPQLQSDMRAHFAASDYPVLVSLRAADGNEVSRVFIVAESWPNT